MSTIKVSFPVEEEINEYSLGDIEISDGNNLLSSKGNSKNLMMIFISLVEFSDGITKSISQKPQKSYEFVGNGSSFRLLIDTKGEQLSMTDPQNKVTLNMTCSDAVIALWQCWQDVDKYVTKLDPKSSVFLDLVSSKNSFQQAFSSIIPS